MRYLDDNRTNVDEIEIEIENEKENENDQIDMVDVNNKIDSLLLLDDDLDMIDQKKDDINVNVNILNEKSGDNNNNNDDESEYETVFESEEEISYLMVSVEPNGNNLFDLTKYNNIKIKDLDSIYPSIELNGCDEYVGKYNMCLGCDMFFKENNQSKLNLLATNNRTITFSKWNPKFESGE